LAAFNAEAFSRRADRGKVRASSQVVQALLPQ
jgi:hypothetical protein